MEQDREKDVANQVVRIDEFDEWLTCQRYSAVGCNRGPSVRLGFYRKVPPSLRRAAQDFQRSIRGTIIDKNKLPTKRASLSAYLLERGALKGLVVVVDIRRGISDLDQTLIDMIGDSLALHVLLTKSDKLSSSLRQRAIDAAAARLAGPRQSLSSLSVVTRAGLTELEQVCREWLA